ncbi:hypothetical protein [Streptomyces zingiberis]|uniref:hypothetical protein n=1 Tax=Streptomyces zingiberis TaxID=2053010 RepID=UPI002893011C|nr:hypothetical protein [Streptomyces zingiberis]
MRDALLGAVGAVPAALFAGALAEQLPEQLHGRFPLTETDPPVGQDATSLHFIRAAADVKTTSVRTRQFPPRTTFVMP